MKWAFWLNLGFALFELIGGLWVNSMAILSDALHDLGDALSLAIGIWLEGKSQTRSDERFSYGYRRFSLLAALITGTILLMGSVWIFGHSIQRVLYPEPVDAPWMMVFALVGVCVNGFAFFKLKGSGHHHHGHGHHHGHVHGHGHHHGHLSDHSGSKPSQYSKSGLSALSSEPAAKHSQTQISMSSSGGRTEANSLHMKMWELHFIEDILGWVVVLIGAVLIYFFNITWLDGALAVLLSLWIAFNVIRNLKSTLAILLQASPSPSFLQQIADYLQTLPEVVSFHHIHVWSLDGEKHILTGHIVLKKDFPFQNLNSLKSKIKTEFASRLNVVEATLEFEWDGEACADPSHRD